MFHALDLAVKILHFALLSVLQNKPFRSAIADTTLLSSSEKVKAQASLYLIAEKWLKHNYNTSGILCGVECAIVERVEDRER